jgi:hypothetical protein
MKKFFLISLGIILLLGAAAGIWSFSGYLVSLQDKNPLSLPDTVTLTPDKDFRVGELITVSAEFSLPRYRKVHKVVLTPGSGTVTAVSGKAVKVRTFWRSSVWKAEGQICPLRPGESQPGVLAFEISSRGDSTAPTAFAVAIPALKISGLPAVTTPDAELERPLELVKKNASKWHYLWLLLLIPVLLLYFVFKKRKVREEKISLRTRTLNALENLRSEVVTRTLSAEQGIARLSDVIRTYLEQRYTLPVSSKTTPEFLEEMENHSPLPESDRPFLQNFLNSADMIKFAKAPCDAPAVNGAIDSAEKLVRNTALPEEEKNV